MEEEIELFNDDIDLAKNINKMFPQKKFGENSLKNLRDNCLDNICKNISYWMEYLPQNANKYLYLITPFDVLCKYNFSVFVFVIIKFLAK